MASSSPRPPTLKDVARAAGVSRSAAGYALRNHPMVSRATCQNVQKVAEQMGYRPNPLVSALMTRVRGGQTTADVDTLAYVTDYPDRARWRRIPSQLEFFEGAQARAEALGYRLEEFSAAEKGLSGTRLSNIMRTRGIRGIILAPLPDDGAPVALNWEFFAVAAIGYTQRDVAVHRVTFDHYHAMLRLLRELKARGLNRIGIALPWATAQRTDQLWVAAHRTFMAESPLQQNVPMWLPQWSEWKSELCVAWFDTVKPDAVVSGESEVRWLRQHRAAAMRKVTCSALNHRGESGFHLGIDQNNRAVGATAVDLVVEQLRNNEVGPPARPRLVLLEGGWRAGAQ